MTPQAGADVWVLANYGALGVFSACSLTILFFAAKWALAEIRRKDVAFAESLRYAMDKHEASIGKVMEGHDRANQAIVAAFDKLASEVRASAKG